MSTGKNRNKNKNKKPFCVVASREQSAEIEIISEHGIIILFPSTPRQLNTNLTHVQNGSLKKLEKQYSATMWVNHRSVL